MKITKEFKKVSSEVSKAYGDCWKGGNYSERNLDFLASEWLTRNEAFRIMSKYVTGYNAFEPSLIMQLPPDAQVMIARKCSVCLFVKTAINIDISTCIESLKCDGADYNKGELSIWWD